MNKNISLIAAVAAVAMVPVAANAQAVTGYGSVGYSHHDLEGADVGAIQGRLGARFNPYLGVEGELGFGVKKDDVSIGGVNGKAELKNSAAIYGGMVISTVLALIAELLLGYLERRLLKWRPPSQIETVAV